jgi:hypothetical protein
MLVRDDVEFVGVAHTQAQRLVVYDVHIALEKRKRACTRLNVQARRNEVQGGRDEKAGGRVPWKG